LTSETHAKIEADGLDIAEASLEELANDRQRSQRILNAIIAEVKSGRGVVFHAATAEQARTFAGVLLYHTVMSVVVTSDMPLHKQAQQVASFQTREDCKVLCVHEVVAAGKEAPKANTAVFSRPYASFDQFSAIISRFAVDREENDVKVIIMDDDFEPFTAMAKYFGQWNTMEVAGGL
jgi:superfamily II DNA or RNA helicase